MKKRISAENGLLWCWYCYDYTPHWHYIGKPEHYCHRCGGKKEKAR